jgi:hypothetical protein
MQRLLLPSTVFLAIGAALAVLSAPRASPDPRPVAERLDDLAADTLPLVRSLPGVAQVRRSDPTNPAARIVHLLDWHLIPEDLHAMDGGKSGQGYEQHLAEVEALQSATESAQADTVAWTSDTATTSLTRLFLRRPVWQWTVCPVVVQVIV